MIYKYIQDCINPFMKIDFGIDQLDRVTLIYLIYIYI